MIQLWLYEAIDRDFHSILQLISPVKKFQQYNKGIQIEIKMFQFICYYFK